MSKSFKALFTTLKQTANQIDDVANDKKLKALQLIHKTPLPAFKEWTEYQNLLLFLSAHPINETFLTLANKEKDRFAKYIKKAKNADKTKLKNSGLPYTTTLSSFSYDLLVALTEKQDVKMVFDYSSEEQILLNDVLQFTLPDMEKLLTSAGNVREDLLSELQVKEEQFLPFLLDQFSKLNHEPYIKDYFWNKLSVYVQLNSEQEKFSKLYNQLSFDKPYYHTDLLRSFDHVELINRELPYFMNLSVAQQDELIDVMRSALIFLERETDPTTYIERRSIRFYQLERGISVAVYTMTPNRQLPLETYAGYTLFKNGFPAAYGGCWLHGKKSLFGINIFEQFRGGESGYLFMQLLRVYREAFGVDYFEVEPYQYGLDNPEGIESGAFWFYYRYGFRPLDKTLEKIAADEYEKIKSKKGYRTPAKTLIRFTESNIALKLGNKVPEGIHAQREKITNYIARNYKGNRTEALLDSMAWFKDKSNFNRLCNKYEESVLKDISLLAHTLNIQSDAKFQLLKEMIVSKPFDMYTFQELLVDFYEEQ
jgi:hypothetical protein